MNLECKYVNRFSINSRKAVLLCGFIILAFLFSTLISLETVRSSDDDSGNKEEISEEEKKDLVDQKKEEINQVRSKINETNAEIKSKQKEARTLSREMSIYQSRINKNELEVEETELAVEAAELEVVDLGNKIVEGEERMEKDKEILRDMIKALYSYEQDSMLQIFMSRNNISDFFNEVGAVESVKDKIFETIVDLKIEKKESELRQEELGEQQESQSQLIQIRYQQNESLDDLKSQKQQLLEETKGEEKKFQQILEENKQILPALRAQLYDLQSLGEKIEFTDAISAAEYASSLTGVRREFILAIFQVETRWGTFEGAGNWEDDMYKCYLRLSEIAQTQKRKAYYVKRAETEKNAFFSIVDRLNLDPNSAKVSKEPVYGCGGAMGFAQFMPSTWLAYEERVSSLVGHSPPNPWNLGDALVTMAVKVSDIPGVVGGDYGAEREAAGRYFGGGAWYKNSYAIKYADKVMIFADLYKKELSM